MKVLRNIRIEAGVVLVDGSVTFRSDDGDFNSFAKALYKKCGADYPKFYKMSPLCKLGFLASELLLRGAGQPTTASGQVSIYLANSSASLHTDIIYQETISSKPSPAVFVYTLPNIVIGEISIRNGFTGEGLFFIQEHFDRDFLCTLAENDLQTGRSAMSLVGWVEIDRGGVYLADLSLLGKV
jgi:hypothetical protein